MQHTTGDCSCQTCSHVLGILCIVWARGITWLGCYRLLCNDDCFSVHINITCIGRIWNINKRVDSSIQASREEYEAATLCTRRSHRRKKAAAYWICVQQQPDGSSLWKHKRPSRDIFWVDVLLNPYPYPISWLKWLKSKIPDIHYSVVSLNRHSDTISVNISKMIRLQK